MPGTEFQYLGEALKHPDCVLGCAALLELLGWSRLTGRCLLAAELVLCFLCSRLGSAQQGCAAGAAQAGVPQDPVPRVPRSLEAGGEEGREITLQSAEGLALISKFKT